MPTRQCIKSLIVSFFVVVSVVSSNVVVAEEKAIRMAIISLSSPAKIHKQWQGFASYLSKKIGRDVDIIVPRGFKKIKQAVENKSVDIFYVNSHVFYKLKQNGKAVAIAQMQNLDGNTISNSVMFVRSDSGVNALRDLKNEKIAFVSPMGAGGYLAPRASFYQHGIKTKTDTKEQFTKNLSSSIHKVLLGDVKAGTMCGLNFKLMSNRMKAGDLKIIATSPDYPENVFAARPELSAELRSKISEIMVAMHSENKGNEILTKMNTMKIKKFVKYDAKSEELTKYLLKVGGFNKK